MRGKKWLKLLAVVMCIALLFTVLVACVDPKDPTDDPNDDNGDQTETPDTSTIVTQMIDKLVGSYVVDDAKYFSVDVAASAQLETKGEGAKRLWRYEVIAKANVNLVNAATDDKTSMLFEINSYTTDENNTEQKTTLFSIFYENEVDADGTLTGSYFYLIFAGEAPIKVNAFSMYKILNLIDPDAVPPIENVVDLDISTIIPMVVGVLIDTAEIKGNDYVLTMDLIKVWSGLSMLITPLLEDPSSLAGILGMEEQAVADIFTNIDGAISEIFGNLTFKATVEDDPETEVDESATPVDKNVASLTDLITYVDQNVPNVLVTLNVNFDDNDKFESASAAATYQPHNDTGVYDAPTHEFKADISKAYVGVNSNVAVDNGYPLTKEQRIAITDVANILNFAIDGTIEMDKNGTVDVLDYSIDADINPFVLFDGLTLDTIKKLGYVNLTVNRSDGGNLLTIHSNFADGSMYLNMVGYGSSFLIKNFNIGGRYDFDALMDAITILGGGKVEVNSVADTAGENNIIIDILKIVLNAINVDNITENGVVIDISSDTLAQIFSYVDLGDSLANSALPMIVSTLLFNGSDSMAIKVNQNGFVYGGCEKINVDQIDFSAFDENDAVGITDPEVYNSIKSQYEYGEPLENGITWSPDEGDDAKTFRLKGKNASGSTKYDLKGVYMGSTYDPYKIGAQKIRIYFASNNLFDTFGGMSSSFIIDMLKANPMIPLNGIQYVEYDVEVLEKVDNTTAFINVEGTNQLGVGENIADKLNATLYYENGRSVKVTNSMISCVKPILDNSGNVLYAGEWEIDVNYYTAHATIKIVVGELVANEFESLILGKDDLKAALNLRIKTMNSNGVYEYSPCDIEIKSLLINREEVSAENAFVAETMKFKNNHNWNDKNVSLTLSYNLFGEIKERTFTFKLKAEGDILKPGSTYYNYNAVADNLLKIVTDDKDANGKDITYIVQYNGSSYVAKYVLKNGSEETVYTYNGSISVTINKVTKNEQGEITDKTAISFAENDNHLRTAGEFVSEFTIGDSTYTHTFKVKEAITTAGTNGVVTANGSFYATFGMFTLNLAADGLIADAKAGSALKFKWDSATVTLSLTYTDTSGATKAVSTDDIEMTLSFKDASGNAVTPIASGTSKITFESSGDYTAGISINIKSINKTLANTLTIKFTK